MNDFSKGIAKPVGIAIGLAIVGGLAWYLLAPRIKAALGAIGTAVNPTSDQNIFYRGTNAVGAAVTGKDSFSLGSWLYDLTHADANLAGNPKPPDEVAWYEQFLRRG